jgi:hypothetical protein
VLDQALHRQLAVPREVAGVVGGCTTDRAASSGTTSRIGAAENAGAIADAGPSVGIGRHHTVLGPLELNRPEQPLPSR